MATDLQPNDRAVAPGLRPTPKPLAENYLAELVGVNLCYALETFQWDELRPWTADGITVAGFRSAASAAKPND